MRSNSLVAMNFGLDPMIEEMRETVARWVDETLAPRAAEIDATNK
ncbi:MAG TPA: acyl-CoA dehydrogenase, partial [Parvularcula sp.]|nr:acyl-CoA dehydrogenase [Parvularcula sp.]